MSEPFVRKSVNILSPLRYPGAKRRLGTYLAEVFKLNGLKPKLLVEPFAGSLSISLQLLHNGLVEKIAVGEKDALIASFWKVAFNETAWLKREIRRIPVTLERWQHFKDNSFPTNRERALACLFLNRTSFSGIMAPSAGPIGGKAQKSEYTIDCRFNVDMLEKRLDQVSALRDKVVFIENNSWEATIEKSRNLGYKQKEIFYYLDPPFYEKAQKLYRHFFVDGDHQKLHDVIMKVKNPWLLSYDAAQEIIEKYARNGSSPKRIGILYSTATQVARSETEELIITNLAHLPKETRLWRKANERKK
jgi:DNA adenine methylase